MKQRNWIFSNVYVFTCWYYRAKEHQKQRTEAWANLSSSEAKENINLLPQNNPQIHGWAEEGFKRKQTEAQREKRWKCHSQSQGWWQQLHPGRQWSVAIHLPSVLSILTSASLSLNNPTGLSQTHDLGNYVSSLLLSFLHVLFLCFFRLLTHKYCSDEHRRKPFISYTSPATNLTGLFLGLYTWGNEVPIPGILHLHNKFSCYFSSWLQHPRPRGNNRLGKERCKRNARNSCVPEILKEARSVLQMCALPENIPLGNTWIK